VQVPLSLSLVLADCRQHAKSEKNIVMFLHALFYELRYIKQMEDFQISLLNFACPVFMTLKKVFLTKKIHKFHKYAREGQR